MRFVSGEDEHRFEQRRRKLDVGVDLQKPIGIRSLKCSLSEHHAVVADVESGGVHHADEVSFALRLRLLMIDEPQARGMEGNRDGSTAGIAEYDLAVLPCPSRASLTPHA